MEAQEPQHPENPCVNCSHLGNVAVHFKKALHLGRHAVGKHRIDLDGSCSAAFDGKLGRNTS